MHKPVGSLTTKNASLPGSAAAPGKQRSRQLEPSRQSFTHFSTATTGAKVPTEKPTVGSKHKVKKKAASPTSQIKSPTVLTVSQKQVSKKK